MSILFDACFTGLLLCAILLGVIWVHAIWKMCYAAEHRATIFDEYDNEEMKS